MTFVTAFVQRQRFVVEKFAKTVASESMMVEVLAILSLTNRNGHHCAQFVGHQWFFKSVTSGHVLMNASS